MPLYLDVHNQVEGLTAAGAAEAHRKGLAVEHNYGVKYLRLSPASKLWSSRPRGKTKVS